MAQRKRFLVVLIKPSHYDEDGYVIQWYRSAIPSNTLATLYGLTLNCAERQVLGADVDIEIEAYDETNTVIPIKRLIRRLKEADGGFVGFVGVQTNQFPHTVDMARQFRAADLNVVIGGFHVSGCLSMLPALPADIKAAQDMGITLYAGESEGRLDEVLVDAWNGTLPPLYNYMDDLPGMAEATRPFLPDNVVKRTAGAYTSFDSGRGCPFQCSFCTIINVQGRKSRYRTADDIEQIIRANAAQGITRYFVTDDNFARNRNWEQILDRLIDLRENQGFRFKFILQVDTLAHRIPGFIEKATRAGAHRIFIGLENINPDSLLGTKKRQNKIWEYRKMLQMWKSHGAMTYAGYILGFPPDTPESIARDVEIIKRELPLDLVEFFVLTPLPGSEDHQKLSAAGVDLDPDMNKYDLEHVTTDHPIMSRDELSRVYRDVWSRYYTPEHVETIMRRGAASGLKPKKMTLPLMWFTGALAIEGIHPLELGFWRRKVRTQRRHGLPIENPLLFYPRRAWEIVQTHYQWARLFLAYRAIQKRIEADPAAKEYDDISLHPVSEAEENALDLMTEHGDAIPHTHGAPRVGVAAE
ncbi:MAG: radical SAM protein [Alphaproteobacteria bacterium]